MKIFVDSNIIIEALKKKGLENAKSIFRYMINDLVNSYYYNLIVYSEVKFKILFKVKDRDSDKVEVFSYLKEIFKFLNFLSSDEITMEISDYLIEKYNLKPNDALILATCKRYGIKYLLSLDGDFKIPCMNEGVVLIDSAKKLEVRKN